VIFKFLTLPVCAIGDENGRLKGLECLRMELGEPDTSGRRSPIPVKGSEYFMPFDSVIHAIGNSPNPLIPATTPGIEIGKKGNIVANNDTGKTSKERVWAGGMSLLGQQLSSWRWVLDARQPAPCMST